MKVNSPKYYWQDFRLKLFFSKERVSLMVPNSNAKTETGPAQERTGKAGRIIEFGENRSFQIELRTRVDTFFKNAGIPKTGGRQMHVKTAFMLLFFLTDYWLLVFVSGNLWLGVALAVFLGLSMAGIGFNIQHDAGHNAYSSSRRINKLMAMTLDLIGGSSYVWHYKHSVVHHTYVNITGYDTDIDIGIFGRLSPHQKRRWFHRWQHFYLWPLYGLLAIKWQCIDDFRYVITGGIEKHRLPRPLRGDLFRFIAGKTFFFGWVFLIPLLLHPVGVVFFYYSIAALALGVTISAVFQLPHCVGESEFPLPDPATGRITSPWAEHQARVTLDFDKQNHLITWLLGGLNYHLEHHLFPMICHTHYPLISPIVEKTCKEFNVRYESHMTLWHGLRSHYRWLRTMGKPLTGLENPHMA
jgi:linoleoyl-CoA desaturase